MCFIFVYVVVKEVIVFVIFIWNNIDLTPSLYTDGSVLNGKNTILSTPSVITQVYKFREACGAGDKCSKLGLSQS